MHFKWHLALRGERLPMCSVLKYCKENVCVYDEVLPIYKNFNTINLLSTFVMYLINIFVKCYIHKMVYSDNAGWPVKTVWYSRMVTDPILLTWLNFDPSMIVLAAFGVVFWHMQLYMSWYIRSFFGFTILNILYFFKYSCTNIFHRRNLYTFSMDK